MEAAVQGSNVKNVKKKIIPVQSDSSESSPSSPAESPQPQSMSLSSRYRLSQQSQPSPQDTGMMQLDVPTSHQPVQGQALGQKLKNSYSFRDRKDPQNLSNRSANNPPIKQKPRTNSVESHHSFRSTTS